MHILGVRLDPVDMAGALEKLERFIEGGSPHLVITLGVEMVMRAQTDARFRQVIAAAELVVPDTVGVIWAARLQGANLTERVAGIDLMERFFPVCVREGFRVFLLGSQAEVARAAADKLERSFPGLLVCGWASGYFEDSQPVVEQIRKAQPHLLLVGMGFPRQELWFWEHREELGVPLAVGVGGSLDVWAGKVKRVPGWLRKLKLEWLARVAGSPKRWKRASVLPVFALKVLWHKFLKAGS